MRSREMDKFSTRHGFEAPDAEITVRHDAPDALREIVVDIAYEAGLTPHSMRGLVCTLLRVPEDRGNWSAFPNVDGEVRDNLSSCEWYEVCDSIEAIHHRLVNRDEEEPWDRGESRAEYFAAELNKYFRRQGIGWQLVGGEIQVRGPEAFEAGLKEAQATLSAAGRSTAANEIHQALMDLSKRPESDLTGALQHALAALECVARDVTGDPKATLGAILGRSKTLLPPPMNDAAEKLWGFASEQGRHLREGRDPALEEVELAVHMAAALATYLSRRVSRGV
jgi:hypothetical protein